MNMGSPLMIHLVENKQGPCQQLLQFFSERRLEEKKVSKIVVMICYMLYFTLLYIIICQNLHYLYENEAPS